MDRMEKACSFRMDRIDERFGLFDESCSCSSINSLVRTIKKATESLAPITKVFQSKVNI